MLVDGTAVFDQRRELPLERRVPMVFYRIVSTSIEEPRDRRPFVSVLGVRLDDDLVFLRRERAVLNLGRKLVAPPETARLAGSTRDRFADQRPIASSMTLHKFLQRLVFVGTPRTLDPIQICSRNIHRSKWIKIQISNPNNPSDK